MSAAISARLDALLHEQFLTRQAGQLRTCIHILKLRHSVTQQQIEDACGVTRSYLSHLVSGKREASEPLMRLIEVFTLSVDAFEQAREGVQLNERFRTVFEVRPVQQKYRVQVASGQQEQPQRTVRFIERATPASL
jgi:transcriptional regulator with XRE-family HTH domain